MLVSLAVRTGLGTMAVLVGSVVVAVILRNYLGAVFFYSASKKCVC